MARDVPRDAEETGKISDDGAVCVPFQRTRRCYQNKQEDVGATSRHIWDESEDDRRGASRKDGVLDFETADARVGSPH